MRFRLQCVAAILIAAQLLLGIPSEILRADEAKLEVGLDAVTPQRQVDALLMQLAAPEFQSRRKAFLELWQLEEEVLPEIRKAKSSADSQIAQSAQMLEILLKLRVQPGDQATSSLLFQLLAEPSPLAVAELCRRKYWKVAEEIIDTNPSVVSDFQEQAGAFQIGRIAQIALEQEEPRKAWPFIRKLADLPLATWIAHQNGLELPEVDPRRIDQVAIRDFYSGNLAAAMDPAVPAATRLRFVTRSGEWSRLSETALQDAVIGPATPTASQAARAALFELAGNVRASRELWDELLGTESADSEVPRNSEGDLEVSARTRAAAGLLEDDLSRAQVGFALLLAGEIEAIELYLQNHDPSHAFVHFLSSSQFERAFEVVGLEPEFANFDAWLQQRRMDMLEQDRLKLYQLFNENARLCNALVNVGQVGEAQQVLQMLVEVIVESRSGSRLASRSQFEGDLWRMLGNWLTQAEPRQMYLSQVQQRYQDIPREIQPSVVKALFPEIGETAAVLLDTAQTEAASPGSTEDWQLRWELLDHLWRLDQDYFAQRASGKEVGNLAELWLKRAKAQMDGGPASGPQLEELSQLALGFGLNDLALQFAIDPLAVDRSHWVEGAEMLLQRGRPQLASECLAQYRRVSRSGRYQALEREVHALLLTGEFQQAEVLEQFRHLAPYDDRYLDTSFSDVSNFLREQEKYAQAIEYAKPAFLLAPETGIQSFWIATDYAISLTELERHRESADVRRAIFVESLTFGAELSGQAFQFQYSWYDYLSRIVYSLQKERMSRAISLIDEGQFAAAWHEIEIGRKLQPQDIEMVVQCFPRLVEGGKPELANQLFETYEREMLQQLTAWSRDATALNNLAWMYAKCERQLDKALELAQQAVQLAPASAIFLDTLAEVQFRRGDQEAAIASMRGCIKLDPRDSHYRENLARFQSEP